MSRFRRFIRAIEVGEHVDFIGKILDFILDPKTLIVMPGSLIVPIITFVEHRPLSEIIILSLSALVLLIATVWGGAMAWQWWRGLYSSPIQHPTRSESSTAIVDQSDTPIVAAKNVCTERATHGHSTPYSSLRVNKAETERIWPAPQPTHRIAVLELCKIAERTINLNLTDKTNEIYFFAKALQQQAGLLRDVEIFGRKLPNGQRNGILLKQAVRSFPLEPIPPSHFNTHWIDLLPTLVAGTENFNIFTYAVGTDNPLMYSDLHVDRQQATRWLKIEARQLMTSYEKTI
jgi:hypothetical protein